MERPPHHVEETCARIASERAEVHVDAGQRRPGGLRHHVPVVETDHGHINRHGETHLPQGVDGAACDLIAAAEDRIGRAAPFREQVPDRLAAPGLRPASRAIVARTRRQSELSERGSIAGRAQADRLEAFRAGNMGDAFAAERGEVSDSELGAALVVGQEAERVRPLHVREYVDDRHAADRRLDRRAPVGAARGDDKTVNALAEQLINVPALALGVVGRIAHEDRDPGIGQAPLQRFDDGKGEAAKTVVRQNSNRHRARAVEAVRQVVGPVADLPGDPQDPGASLCAEASAGVERLGCGSDRDAGAARDVADGSRRLRKRLVLGRQAVAQVVHLTAPESSPDM